MMLKPLPAGIQTFRDIIEGGFLPLIDHLENPETAIAIREVLRGFYTAIKGMDESLRFVLLTGISKFSKGGVFSGLNNLEDLTMASRFAALGITEAEIEAYF